MSVVIRGMKMPKSCDECPCYYETEGAWRNECEVLGKEYIADDYRPEWCPLIELPAQHGRLGDLDAMAFDESEAYMSAQAKLGRDVITTGIYSIVHRKIQLLIMDTPTIIEAEEVSE